MNILHFKQVDSTNNKALEILDKEQLPEFTMLTADYQTKGKGQHNRKWHSKAGENIILSIIVYPRFLSVHNLFYLSKAAAITTKELIKLYCKPIFIKWPNDIYVNQHKIAGILIENKISPDGIIASVIGVGINVNQQHFPSEIPNPTSLFLETGKVYHLQTLIAQWYKLFLNYYQLLKQEQYLAIEKEYHDFLYRKNQITTFISKNQETIQGKILKVSPAGELVLEEGNQLKAYKVGEIEMVLST